MIKVCKPLLVPAYTPSGKTSADPLGWTDELSGGSVLVPVGYDQEYIEYTSNMFYAVSLAASTAYTFHSNGYGGAPITLYDASGTQVAAATGEYDEDTGEYLFPDLTYTPSAAGIFVIKFGVNDYMGMGEPYTATISPTPATHSCIVPAHAGSMAGRDVWGYLKTYRDTASAHVMHPEFSYLKFQVDAVRNSGMVQLSKFQLCNEAGNEVAWSNFGTLEITSDAGNDHGGESPDSLFDGSTNTKWCVNFSDPSYVIVHLPTPISLADYPSYRWYTANDEDGRDPVSWQVFTSEDGTNWKTVSAVTNYATTTNRQTLAGTWNF